MFKHLTNRFAYFFNFIHFTQGNPMWSTEYRYYTNNASESWSNKATPRFNELVKQENENRMKYEEKVKDNNVDERVDRFMHITNEESESDDEQCSEKDNEDNITWGTPIEV